MAACTRRLLPTHFANILTKLRHDRVDGCWSVAVRSKVDKAKEAAKKDASEAQSTEKPLAILTDDGLFKNSGTLIGHNRTADGKPIYPGKHKWYRLPEGTNVFAGNLLCYQKKLDYHPGLNVGIGRDLTLYAYEEGTVYITWEKVNFNWKKKFINEFHADDKDMNIYKPYYHVIAKEQSKKFKLIDRV